MFMVQNYFPLVLDHGIVLHSLDNKIKMMKYSIEQSVNLKVHNINIGKQNWKFKINEVEPFSVGQFNH